MAALALVSKAEADLALAISRQNPTSFDLVLRNAEFAATQALLDAKERLLNDGAVDIPTDVALDIIRRAGCDADVTRLLCRAWNPCVRLMSRVFDIDRQMRLPMRESITNCGGVLIISDGRAYDLASSKWLPFNMPDYSNYYLCTPSPNGAMVLKYEKDADETGSIVWHSTRTGAELLRGRSIVKRGFVYASDVAGIACIAHHRGKSVSIYANETVVPVSNILPFSYGDPPAFVPDASALVVWGNSNPLIHTGLLTVWKVGEVAKYRLFIFGLDGLVRHVLNPFSGNGPCAPGSTGGAMFPHQVVLLTNAGAYRVDSSAGTVELVCRYIEGIQTHNYCWSRDLTQFARFDAETNRIHVQSSQGRDGCFPLSPSWCFRCDMILEFDANRNLHVVISYPYVSTVRHMVLRFP